MDIFFSTDNNYVEHLCVAITSIIINSKQSNQLDFYILDGGISDNNKDVIRGICRNKVNFITIDESLVNKFHLNQKAHQSNATYIRFLIPNIKKDAKKVIYLDSDLIVLQPIEELWNIDLGDRYLGVCEDTWAPMIKYKSTIGLKEKPYFNAGVMLMNLEKMREDGIVNVLFDSARKLGQSIRYADQDVMNLVCQDRILFLPLKWNVQGSTFFMKSGLFQASQHVINEAITAPAIIHYVGKRKPWHFKCEHPFRSEYIRYYKASLLQENQSKYQRVNIVNKFYFLIKPLVNIYLKTRNILNKKPASE